MISIGKVFNDMLTFASEAILNLIKFNLIEHCIEIS